MNFRELTLDAYTKLHDAIDANTEPPVVQLLGFDYTSNSNDFIYSIQEDDFTRELVNLFNQFAYWLNRISLLEKVLSQYSDNDREELRYEFTKLPLDYCLQFPYQLRSRLIFYATQLCYTCGVAKKLIPKSEVEADERIKFISLKSVSVHWEAAALLVEAICNVDAETYRTQTQNYRNKSQHRHAPCIDFGYVSNIARTFPKGSRVAYSFGQTPPLMAADLLPILIEEADRLRKAFFAYRGLITDHWPTGSNSH